MAVKSVNQILNEMSIDPNSVVGICAHLSQKKEQRINRIRKQAPYSAKAKTMLMDFDELMSFVRSQENENG